ncbi:hypothetical protein Ocin01_10278, partial [Orchesella cincta]
APSTLEDLQHKLQLIGTNPQQSEPTVCSSASGDGGGTSTQGTTTAGTSSQPTTPQSTHTQESYILALQQKLAQMTEGGASGPGSDSGTPQPDQAQLTLGSSVGGGTGGTATPVLGSSGSKDDSKSKVRPAAMDFQDLEAELHKIHTIKGASQTQPTPMNAVTVGMNLGLGHSVNMAQQIALAATGGPGPGGAPLLTTPVHYVPTYQPYQSYMTSAMQQQSAEDAAQQAEAAQGHMHAALNRPGSNHTAGGLSGFLPTAQPQLISGPLGPMIHHSVGVGVPIATIPNSLGVQYTVPTNAAIHGTATPHNSTAPSSPASSVAGLSATSAVDTKSVTAVAPSTTSYVEALAGGDIDGGRLLTTVLSLSPCTDGQCTDIHNSSINSSTNNSVSSTSVPVKKVSRFQVSIVREDKTFTDSSAAGKDVASPVTLCSTAAETLSDYNSAIQPAFSSSVATDVATSASSEQQPQRREMSPIRKGRFSVVTHKPDEVEEITTGVIGLDELATPSSIAIGTTIHQTAQSSMYHDHLQNRHPLDASIVASSAPPQSNAQQQQEFLQRRFSQCLAPLPGQSYGPHVFVTTGHPLQVLVDGSNVANQVSGPPSDDPYMEKVGRPTSAMSTSMGQIDSDRLQLQPHLMGVNSAGQNAAPSHVLHIGSPSSASYLQSSSAHTNNTNVSPRRRKISVIRVHPIMPAGPVILEHYQNQFVSNNPEKSANPSVGCYSAPVQQNAPPGFPNSTLPLSSPTTSTTTGLTKLTTPSHTLGNPNSDPQSPTLNSLSSSKRLTSQSIADLPSKLSEIFKSSTKETIKARPLSSMKTLAKSCADLRRIDDTDEATGSGSESTTKDGQSAGNTVLSPDSPASINSPLMFSYPNTPTDSPAIRGNFSSVKNPLDMDLIEQRFTQVGTAGNEKIRNSYHNTVHPRLPTRASVLGSPPIARSKFLSGGYGPSEFSSEFIREKILRRQRPDSSISDSEDEGFYPALNINTLSSMKAKSARSSPQRLSPTKMRPIAPGVNFLADDPSRLLKAKLKHTHSLSNLPDTLMKESARRGWKTQGQSEETPLTRMTTITSGNNASISTTPSKSSSAASASVHSKRPKDLAFQPTTSQPNDNVYYTVHSGVNPLFYGPSASAFKKEYQYGGGVGGISSSSSSGPSRPLRRQSERDGADGCIDCDVDILDESFEDMLEGNSFEESCNMYPQQFGNYYYPFGSGSGSSYNNTRRSGSPSSGYKTMGPYNYATISSYPNSDPHLVKYLREREKNRLLQQQQPYKYYGLVGEDDHEVEGDRSSEPQPRRRSYEMDPEYQELLEKHKLEEDDMRARHRLEFDLFLKRRKARLATAAALQAAAEEAAAQSHHSPGQSQYYTISSVHSGTSNHHLLGPYGTGGRAFLPTAAALALQAQQHHFAARYGAPAPAMEQVYQPGSSLGHGSMTSAHFTLPLSTSNFQQHLQNMKSFRGLPQGFAGQMQAGSSSNVGGTGDLGQGSSLTPSPTLSPPPGLPISPLPPGEHSTCSSSTVTAAPSTASIRMNESAQSPEFSSMMGGQGSTPETPTRMPLMPHPQAGMMETPMPNYAIQPSPYGALRTPVYGQGGPPPLGPGYQNAAAAAAAAAYASGYYFQPGYMGEYTTRGYDDSWIVPRISVDNLCAGMQPLMQQVPQNMRYIPGASISPAPPQMLYGGSPYANIPGAQWQLTAVGPSPSGGQMGTGSERGTPNPMLPPEYQLPPGMIMPGMQLAPPSNNSTNNSPNVLPASAYSPNSAASHHQ